MSTRAPSDDSDDLPEWRHNPPHMTPTLWVPLRARDVPVRARCTSTPQRHEFSPPVQCERLRLYDRDSMRAGTAVVVDNALSIGVSAQCHACGLVVFCESIVPTFIERIDGDAQCVPSEQSRDAFEHASLRHTSEVTTRRGVVRVTMLCHTEHVQRARETVARMWRGAVRVL